MTTWIPSNEPASSWNTPGKYPLQTNTAYDEDLIYDYEFMTYDGVLLSNPGWGDGIDPSTAWLLLNAVTSSWNPTAPEDTAWT